MPESVAVEPLAMADAQVKQAIGKDRVEVSSGCYINPDWLMIILGGIILTEMIRIPINQYKIYSNGTGF